MKVITVRQAVLDIWNDFNNPLEGRVHFMYLDVKGLVTTGMGNLIDSTADAEQLAWQHSDGTPASTDEIDAEWKRVKGLTDLAPKGGGAFAAGAQLFLADEVIDRVVLLKLGQMETTLKGREPFKAFDDAPADAQLGLMSMAWGMGPMFAFPKFQAFVAAGDWDGASTECRFQPDIGTITTRNDRDQQLFRNAATVVRDGLDPDVLVWAP